MTAWTSDPTAAHAPEVVTRVRWWRSIRVRTAGSIAFLSAVLVGSVGLVLAHLALESGTALLRQEAVAKVETGLAVYGFGGAPPPGIVVDPDKVPALVVRAVDRSSGRAVTWDDGRVMWAARPANPSGIIATSVSNAPLLVQADRISRTLLWTIAAAVLLSALFAWVIADRLTVRLRAAAASVNHIIDGEQTAPPPQRDEVAVMTAALSATAAALTARLQREQAFTADVAHDLRTPLTALVSATELLEDSPDADRVRRQVARMRHLVEDLLELARADQGDNGAIRPVALSDAARGALEHLAPADDCLLRVIGDPVVEADPVRLRSAVTNLIANARRHGRGPIEITVDPDGLAVHDHGRGFPEELLRDGPRRFAALGASQGAGLGLAIVVEHAHACGLRLALTNGSEGGATARLRPASAAR